MSVAYAMDVRAVPVLRAGAVARDLCRHGGRGEVAAVFERSCYLRIGNDFICIGEPSIGNGPTTLTVAARVAGLGLRQGQRALVSDKRIATGDLSFDLAQCQTWRAPPWPRPPSPAALHATCANLAERAAASPPDSLAHAVFASADTPLARLARPRVAAFASWLSVGWAKREARAHHQSSRAIVGGHAAFAALRPLSPPYGSIHDLVGLGPGLTPSGDDFLIGALAALDALQQTNIHAELSRAVADAIHRTAPLSASLLRAAAAGHVGENLHAMVAAIVTGEANAAVAAAARIGHTSGFDALAGVVVAMRNVYRC